MFAAAIGLALVIGVVVGLLGGGGSILTTPILTYALGLPPTEAIASSLFVVAATSASGMIAHARAGRVQWRTGLLFGVAGMSGAYLGGRLARGLSGHTLMIMFAVMMAAAALAMLRPRPALAPTVTSLPVLRVLGLGAVVGLVVGTVGAGGGFLVVPALVVVGGLAIEQAIGTSLLVITLQSIAGFLGHDHAAIDWRLTLSITAAAVVGALLGGTLTARVSPTTLRRSFGWFVLAMAALVLVRELAT